jgi:hypothetical protein
MKNSEKINGTLENPNLWDKQRCTPKMRSVTKPFKEEGAVAAPTVDFKSFKHLLKNCTKGTN